MARVESQSQSTSSPTALSGLGLGRRASESVPKSGGATTDIGLRKLGNATSLKTPPSETLQRYNADETATSYTFQTATEKSEVAFQKCEKPASNGHCSSVAVSEVPQASMDGFVKGGHKCSQCGKDGANLYASYGGSASTWLHRECIEEWRAAYDQLDVRNQPFYRPAP